MQNPSPVLLGTLQYQNSSRREVVLPQADVQQEAFGLKVQVEFTIKSTAGGFNMAAADLPTIAQAIATRIYGVWDGDNNALSLLTSELRAVAEEMTGLDPWQEDPQLRSGKALPATGGNALNAKLPFVIPWGHDGADSPNLYAKSTDQLNANPFKVAMDCVGTGLATLVLTNGTAVIAITDVKIFAEEAEAFGIFCGPHWRFETKNANQDFDEEKTPGIEWMLFQETDPITFETIFSFLTVDVDGRQKPRNISPTALAAFYQRTRLKQDAVRGIDLTANSQGGVTPQYTPIRWVGAHRKAAEHELPIIVGKRKITFTKAAGASPAYSFLRTVTDPIVRLDATIRYLMSQAGVGGKPSSLRVRGLGGSDNNTLSQFKGVWIKSGG